MDSFPIDIVYTWVDGSDPRWLARKQERINNLITAGGQAPSKQAIAPARFSQSDELRFSMRSIARYAPWVRKIFVVTDRQVPDWLAIDHPKVVVVDHSEIFDNAGDLPTFNSMAIGLALPNIKNLAEHFLYLNDDVFLGARVREGTFFERDGRPICFVGHSYENVDFAKLCAAEHLPAHKQNDYQRSIGYCRSLVYRTNGVEVRHRYRHGVKCFRKSDVAQILRENHNDVERTLGHPFRSPGDVPISGLNEVFGIGRGLVVPAFKSAMWRSKWINYLRPSTSQYVYCDLGSESEMDKLALIEKYHPFMFCINAGSAIDSNARARMVRFLEQYFPEPAAWEL